MAYIIDVFLNSKTGSQWQDLKNGMVYKKSCMIVWNKFLPIILVKLPVYQLPVQWINCNTRIYCLSLIPKPSLTCQTKPPTPTLTAKCFIRFFTHHLWNRYMINTQTLHTRLDLLCAYSWHTYHLCLCGTCTNPYLCLNCHYPPLLSSPGSCHLYTTTAAEFKCWFNHSLHEYNIYSETYNSISWISIPDGQNRSVIKEINQ